MRNLNGTGTTTGEGALAFGTIPLYFVGGGEVAGPTATNSFGKAFTRIGKSFSNLKNAFFNFGKTFPEYRAAYWKGKTKIPSWVLRNEETGQIWVQHMELHHRFIPQRWNWPNWITNNRFNLKAVNSLEHAMMDPYRARFAPKWVKEYYKLIWK